MYMWYVSFYLFLLYILYFFPFSSGVLWETCKLKSKRFKPMHLEDMVSIEEAYVKYLSTIDIPAKYPNAKVEIRPNLEVL